MYPGKQDFFTWVQSISVSLAREVNSQVLQNIPIASILIDDIVLPLRFYRLLLRCYPAPFRQEYGREMASAFVEQVLAARRDGDWLTEASIWLHTALDVFRTAPQEHFSLIQQDLRYSL